MSGELEDTLYGRLAPKYSIRGNVELYEVPDRQGKVGVVRIQGKEFFARRGTTCTHAKVSW